MHSSSRIERPLPISDGISLISVPSAGEGKTKGMDKGPFLCYQNEVLAGESAGFGLPILRARCRTYFPSLVSAAQIAPTRSELVFQLDREGALSVLRRRFPRPFFFLVEMLVDTYMKVPKCQRSLLSVADALRSLFRVESAIVPGSNQGQCRVVYEVRDGALSVEVDAGALADRGRLIMMNEVAGTAFDRLRYGESVLEGDKIPGWKLVPFGTVFESPSVGIGFSLDVPEEENTTHWRLACGREVAPDLNWSGFALMTDQRRFSYRVNFRVN